MAYTQRDNAGSLFRNDDRKTDSHPNAKGKCMIDGVMYFVDSWTKGEGDKRFQSLSFKRMEKQPDAAPAAKPASQRVSTPDNFDDLDPPF